MTDIGTQAEAEEQRSKRVRLARILSWVGSLWFLLVIAANFGLFRSLPFDAFIGGTLFFPIAMMFAGRVLRRRSLQVPDVESGPPARSRNRTQETPEKVPAPATTRSQQAPSPISEPLPSSVLDDPSPVESRPRIPVDPEQEGFMTEQEEFITELTEFHIKTSDEMIAEAKQRLAQMDES